MISPAQIDSPPRAKGCVQTVKCECGWESVHVMPEEHERRLLAIFQHMRDAHGLTLPNFEVECF